MHRPVSTSTLTSTLKPRPKKALVSPRTHQGSFERGLGSVGASVTAQTSWRDEGATGTLADGATQPKMPPWAAIISRPTRWNSGK